MKLERERNIPAFQNTSWRERIALRRLAQGRDPSIIWLYFPCGIFTGACLPLARWILSALNGEVRLLPWMALYALMGIPVAGLFRAAFITPRIRHALEPRERPAV